MRRATDPAVDAELREIAKAFKGDLRERYRKLFGCDPPKAFGPDLLRRSVAHRVQEDAYGGLSKANRRELNRLVRLMIEKPGTRLNPARHAKAGTVLVRDYKGTSHRVDILDSGFGYQGKTFSNLSEIARTITGTRWNGPRFFGLRRQPSEQETLTTKAPRTHRPAAMRTPGSLRTARPQRTRVGHGL